LLKYLKV